MLQFDPTIQFSDLAVLITILVVAYQIFRHMNRMEFKVELMWQAFKMKFMSNGEIEVEEKKEKLGRHRV